ncbi:MAG: helix-turn-helix transcriptional regulator [Bacteroidales bacterium]|nr:helix-turn-helix transcriptional regulator [Bacteroidales bacterium]
MELGRIISLLIKKRNLTQVKVAEKIGKSTTALSQIIKGTYNPNPDTLNKICEVLEIPLPIMYFLTISEEDIPEDKIEMFRFFEPTIKDFLINLFGIEQKEILNEYNKN